MYETMFFRTVKSGLDLVSSGNETIYEKPPHVADTALRIETESFLPYYGCHHLFRATRDIRWFMLFITVWSCGCDSSGAVTAFIANDVEN